MSAQHTPGPWRINPCFQTMISNCEDGDDSADICEVSEWTPEFWDERDANARLIAAAPELLEALEKAIHARVIRDGDVVDTMRAAIAKAKGEKA